MSDDKETSDGALWMLDPYELNRKNSGLRLKDGFVYSPSFVGNRLREKKMINRWLPWANDSRLKKIPSLPLGLYPSHFARRIENQRSSFTIHGSDRGGLDKAWRPGGPLLRIVIPAKRKRYFRDVLRDMGIDTASVYPDLSGLGKLLAEKWSR